MMGAQKPDDGGSGSRGRPARAGDAFGPLATAAGPPPSPPPPHRCPRSRSFRWGFSKRSQSKSSHGRYRGELSFLPPPPTLRFISSSPRLRTAGSFAPAAEYSCLPNITSGLFISHHAGTPAVPIFATKPADEDRVVLACRAPISGPSAGRSPQVPQREEGYGGPAEHLAPSQF